MILSCELSYSQNNNQFKLGEYYNISLRKDVWMSRSISKCSLVLDSTVLYLYSDSTFSMKKYHLYTDCPVTFYRCDSTWGAYNHIGNKLMLTSDKSDIDYKQGDGLFPCLFFVEDDLSIIDNKTLCYDWSKDKSYIFKLIDNKRNNESD